MATALPLPLLRLCAYNVCAGRSIMDYPGFQSAEPPDFETFSKSINGGQYPLSVLALGPRVPEIYVQVRRHPLWQLPPCTRAHARIAQVPSRPSGLANASGSVRQHDDDEPTRAERGVRGAERVDPGAAPERAQVGPVRGQCQPTTPLPVACCVQAACVA